MDMGFEKLSWGVIGSEEGDMDGSGEKGGEDVGAAGRDSGVELVGRMLEMLMGGEGEVAVSALVKVT